MPAPTGGGRPTPQTLATKETTCRFAVAGPGAHRTVHQGARRDRRPRGRATSRPRRGGWHPARSRLGQASTSAHWRGWRRRDSVTIRHIVEGRDAPREVAAPPRSVNNVVTLDPTKLIHVAKDGGLAVIAEYVEAETGKGAGRSTRSIAEEVGVQPRIVSNWRRRFADHGLAGLEDRPRGSKKPIYGKATNKRILALLDKPPPDGYARWTGPLLAKALERR